MEMAVQDCRSVFLHQFLALCPDLPRGFNDRLAAQVLAHEPEILAGEGHQPIAGMVRSMTTAWKAYNVLTWGTPEADLLRTVIATAVQRYAACYGLTQVPSLIQCWANVLRAGEKFEVHNHGGPTAIAGTYYVTGDAPTGHTYYKIATDPDVRWATVRPQAGVVNLFQSNLLHGVTEYEGDTPRISIAFDVVFTAAPSSQFVPLFDAMSTDPSQDSPTG